MSDTPKRGREWLARKLDEASEALWREPETQRFGFRSLNAHLVDSRKPQRNSAGKEADEIAETRASLAGDKVALMSIRVKAYDRRERKFKETLIKASLLKRIITRVQPSRAGIGHSRYTIALLLLTAEGVAKPLDSGSNGYEWTEQYRRLSDRAEWLVDICSRRGELANLQASHRYSIVYD